MTPADMAKPELQAICGLLETQELAHSRVGLRGPVSSYKVCRSPPLLPAPPPVTFLSSRRGKLGVGELPLPTIPCACVDWGVEDWQVGGAVDRWLSGWDPFQRTV